MFKRDHPEVDQEPAGKTAQGIESLEADDATTMGESEPNPPRKWPAAQGSYYVERSCS